MAEYIDFPDLKIRVHLPVVENKLFTEAKETDINRRLPTYTELITILKDKKALELINPKSKWMFLWCSQDSLDTVKSSVSRVIISGNLEVYSYNYRTIDSNGVGFVLLVEDI